MNVFFYVILNPFVIFRPNGTPYHDFEPTVFALNPQCYMLSGEAAATNLIVFGLTWSELEHAFYHARDEHTTDYTTDYVAMFWFWWYTVTVASHMG